MKAWSAILFVLIPLLSVAETVVPIASVQEHVNIRLLPDASSEIVGRLKQGESAALIGTTEGWYEVALEGDASGYISADWTRVVDDEEMAEETAEEIVVEEALVEAVASSVTAVTDAVADEVAAVDDVTEVADEEAAEDEAVATAAVDATADVIAETVAEEQAVPAVESVAPMQPASVPVVQAATTSALIKGTRNFLVRFRDESEGGNSQIFDDGNQIGIGTTTPKQRLEVNGSIQIHEQNSSVAGLMITQSSGETGYIMHNRASTLTIGAGSQDRITIDRNGNVGFAVSRPKHPLEMASGAHVTSGGVWTNSSSRERKENIVPLSGEAATSTLMALDPVQFNYKNEVGENYVGFIAEDVPDLVAMNGRDSLSAMDIVAVLTRVVQEQQKMIEALERRLDD
jgi:hypothetical protein